MGNDRPEKQTPEPNPKHPSGLRSEEAWERVLDQQRGAMIAAQVMKVIPLTDAEQTSPIKLAAAQPEKAGPKVEPGHKVQAQSILDFAVHKAMCPIDGLITDQAVQNLVAENTKDFIKTAPLFMVGKVAGVAALVSYAADEVKTTDRGMDLLEDAGLGLAKGGALKVSQNYLLGRNHTPSLLGVELGVVNRATAVGLTKENYYDKDGKFNLGLGLGKTALASVESIGTDALVYGAADLAWGRAFTKSRGAATYNQVLTTALSASAFNVTTAAGAEVTRQIDAGKFEPGALASRSLSAGFVGLGAGILAGLQKRSFLSLEVKDSPSALKEARSTPFQLGHVADPAQATFRDGNFIPEIKIKGPTGVSWLGKLQHEGGQSAAIFRVNDGTEGFAHRMQSEIAGYGLNKEIGFKNPFPTTVARSVELEGKQVPGFIQEIRGTDLVKHLHSAGVESKPGRVAPLLDKTQLINHLNDNPALQSSLSESWAERMVLGEWDNHALNQVVERTTGGDQALNIDLGDGLRPAATQLDLVPNAGLRRSYENSNAYIYNKLAGQPLAPDVVEKLQSFVDRSGTEAGRDKLQGLGLTPQQAEGVLGRSDWFATNQKLPPANETPGYVAVKTVIKKVLGGARWAKRTLKNALTSDAVSDESK